MTNHLRWVFLGMIASLSLPLKADFSPLPPPVLPAVQTRVFSITDFGAVADGKTLDTDAINKAITAANAAGGGRVLVPASVYLTGPIQLLSDVELNLDAGATIQFTRDADQYPLVVSNYEGTKAVRCRSPLWADGAHDISITGHGTIDGGGDAWRAVKRRNVPADVWKHFVESGGVLSTDRGAGKPDYSDPNGAESNTESAGQTWYPSTGARDGVEAVNKLRSGPDALNPTAYEKYRQALRPTLVELVNCDKVLLDGPTFRNSPSWNLHPLYTGNLTLKNVTIFNEFWAANGDGIDIDSCHDVLMTDCDVNAGDDGICIKSGRDAQGREVGKPTENVTITRCKVGRAHGGFVIGSEMSGGVKNIWCSNCTFTGTDVGLRFKTTRGRGGVVENIHIDSITMSHIRNEAILFDMYYMIKGAKNGKREPKPVDETTPSFRDIHASNITCDGCAQAIKLSGLPELPLKDVTLQNVNIDHAQTGITLEDCASIQLHQVKVRVAKGEPIHRGENVTDLIQDGVDAAHE